MKRRVDDARISLPNIAMAFSAITLLAAFVLYGHPIFATNLSSTATALPSPQTIGSDIWLLFQNDLNWHTTANHTSTILISSQTHNEAVSACSQFSEGLLSTNGEFFTSDIKSLMQFIELEGEMSVTQSFWVNNPSRSSKDCATISLQGISQANCDERLPAFCSNSAPNRISNDTDLSPQFQVQVTSGNLVFTGTRDHLSFRFLGIPYSNNPERFTYSSVFTGPPNDISALSYGSPCVQVGGTGEENCLFINIWTPFLPNGPNPNAAKLKPVMFFIHGGAFTGGEGSDAIYDGGNLASRGDIVLVTINYRLGALGFMALEDGVTNGNYGIADQITALEWVQRHISSFGGDPSRITIFGQSAGAGSVRALLAAPPAFGLFAGAISQSNLDGYGFASTYSNYFTIAQSAELVGNPTVEGVGCANGTAEEVLACLRAVPALTLQNFPSAPKFVVVDGKFIKTNQLILDGSEPVAPAHAIFGWMRDDGVDFQGPFPTSNSTTLSQLITTGVGISANITNAVLNSQLFPIPNTGNASLDLFNVTNRVSTDGQFRCLDQATIFSAAKHGLFKSLRSYQFDRSYGGYEPIPGICDAPITPSHPFGDPNLPYFRCHSGELSFTFGNLGQSSPGVPFRDSNDLLFEQVVADQWTSFAHSFDPNPDPQFLQARGYTNTTQALRAWGSWEEVGKSNSNGTNVLRVLDVPSTSVAWMEQEQCNVLGFGLDFYE